MARRRLPERLPASQALQHLHLLGVRAVARAWHLENERKSSEAGLSEQGSEARLTDLTGPDVGVPIAVGTQAGHRIVAVDHLNPGHTDDAVQLIDGA